MSNHYLFFNLFIIMTTSPSLLKWCHVCFSGLFFPYRSERFVIWWTHSMHVVFLLPILLVHKLTWQIEKYMVVCVILKFLLFGSETAQHTMHLGRHFLTLITISCIEASLLSPVSLEESTRALAFALP